MWPRKADYQQSVQNPYGNLDDDELQSAQPEMDASSGLPKVWTGGSAAVFLLKCEKRKVAMRCFLTQTTDRQSRFSSIQRELKLKTELPLPGIVSFEYLQKGIRVQGGWYPVVKMEWVEGLTLTDYLRKYGGDSAKVRTVADNWVLMSAAWRARHVAHGNLQGANVFVTSDDQIKLVDYDGIYVPALSGHSAEELGCPNYQHPGRNHSHFGEFLDNFTDWIIYISLVAISVDQRFLKFVDFDERALIFRKKDFLEPAGSEVIYRLKNHSSEELKLLGAHVEKIIGLHIQQVPALDPKSVVPVRPVAPKPQVDPSGKISNSQLQNQVQHPSASANQFAATIPRMPALSPDYKPDAKPDVKPEVKPAPKPLPGTESGRFQPITSQADAKPGAKNTPSFGQSSNQQKPGQPAESGRMNPAPAAGVESGKFKPAAPVGTDTGGFAAAAQAESGKFKPAAPGGTESGRSNPSPATGAESGKFKPATPAGTDTGGFAAAPAAGAESGKFKPAAPAGTESGRFNPAPATGAESGKFKPSAPAGTDSGRHTAASASGGGPGSKPGAPPTGTEPGRFDKQAESGKLNSLMPKPADAAKPLGASAGFASTIPSGSSPSKPAQPNPVQSSPVSLPRKHKDVLDLDEQNDGDKVMPSHPSILDSGPASSRGRAPAGGTAHGGKASGEKDAAGGGADGSKVDGSTGGATQKRKGSPLGMILLFLVLIAGGGAGALYLTKQQKAPVANNQPGQQTDPSSPQGTTGGDTQVASNPGGEQVSGPEMPARTHATDEPKPSLSSTSSDADAANRAGTPGPQMAPTLCREGRKYLERKQYQSAISKFELAIKEDPNSAEAFGGRADGFVGLKRYAEALDDYTKALSIEPDNKDFYKGRGWAYLSLEQFIKAIADYKKAISLDKEDAVLYSDLGRCYGGLTQYQQAVEYFNQSLERKPAANTYYLRGGTFYCLQKFEEALADYKKAAELNPKDADAWYGIGSCYYCFKKYKEAREPYKKAIALYAANGNTMWVNKATAFLKEVSSTDK